MVLIKIKNKSFKINPIKECKGLSQAIGLMFSSKNNATALDFKFKKPTHMAIHSLFCPDFVAIWMIQNKVLEYKVIDKTLFSVKPRGKFDRLIEVPINNTYRRLLVGLGIAIL